MTLTDFTDAQLRRIYRKLYSQLYTGDPYGWDWPTLRAVYPTKAAIMYRILWILHDRSETNERQT